MGKINRFGRRGRTPRDGYGPTSRSLIRRATEISPAGNAALAEFCCRYEPFIFGRFHRLSRDPEVTQELTQRLIVQRILSRQLLVQVIRSGQKLRALLTIAADWVHKDFVRKERRHLFLEGAGQSDEDGRPSLQVADPRSTPEERCHYAHLLEVCRFAYEQVRQEHAEKGESDIFEALEQYLPGRTAYRSYKEQAGLLHLTPEALRQRVHRMTKDYLDKRDSELRRRGITPQDVAEFQRLPRRSP
jgi:hypothetical protein